MDYSYINHDAYVRFNYKSFQTQPPMAITVDTKKFMMAPGDGTDWGDLVIHPGAHPSTAYSYKLKVMYLKTPSEHSVDYMH